MSAIKSQMCARHFIPPAIAAAAAPAGACGVLPVRAAGTQRCAHEHSTARGSRCRLCQTGFFFFPLNQKKNTIEHHNGYTRGSTSQHSLHKFATCRLRSRLRQCVATFSNHLEECKKRMFTSVHRATQAMIEKYRRYRTSMDVHPIVFTSGGGHLADVPLILPSPRTRPGTRFYTMQGITRSLLLPCAQLLYTARARNSPQQCWLCRCRRWSPRLRLVCVQVACWQPTAGPKRDVPTLDVFGLKIAVRVALSRFTASLWIAVRERSL